MNDIAYRLIGKYSKMWLCNKMELNYITLMSRIKNDNWKESEKLLLHKLNNIF